MPLKTKFLLSPTLTYLPGFPPALGLSPGRGCFKVVLFSGFQGVSLWILGPRSFLCRPPLGPKVKPQLGHRRVLQNIWPHVGAGDGPAPWLVVRGEGPAVCSQLRPASHRYVGELISDSEADVREEDSYLFDLDNKVTRLEGLGCRELVAAMRRGSRKEACPQRPRVLAARPGMLVRSGLAGCLQLGPRPRRSLGLCREEPASLRT